MARTKNVGGGLGDDDRRPLPRQPIGSKGKSTKQVTSKKRKYPNTETARAAAVAEAAERVLREVVPTVELSLQISRFHQQSELRLRRLSVVTVVQLGLPHLQDDGLPLRKARQQSRSQFSRLRRASRHSRPRRPRRQSRHPSFATLDGPVYQSRRGRRHSGGDHVCGGINPYTLTAKFGLARIDGFGPPERRRVAQLT